MEEIREIVREKYAQAITKKKGGGQSCCSSCCGDPVSQATQAITGGLYSPGEVEGLPRDAVLASFGCGNPTALAELHAGEVVLDLGSGAGLDVLLSARRVGPYGKAYGLDMTDEMLAEARANQAKAGLHNVEFLKGHIEDIPLPDNTVDVIISNCVINLSADKDKVLQEAYRVLKPGGRFAVSDIVITKPLPQKVRENLMAWAGCISGALRETEYREKLAAAGFEDIGIQITRVYDASHMIDAAKLLAGLSKEEIKRLEGAVVSAFIRAKKPARVMEAGKDYIIRPAGTNDFIAVERLLTECGLTAAGVKENLDNFLIADRAGVIGVIGMEQADTAVLLRSLAVTGDYRKAGIATALVKRMLNQARDRGATRIYLLTNTAEQYFTRLGFRKIERRQIPQVLLEQSALENTCPASSICMELEL